MQVAFQQSETFSAAACLRQATILLQTRQCESAALDARILLLYTLKLTPEEWVANPDRVLTSEEYSAYKALINRREAGEPVAYLTGKREFWGLDFTVTADTLDPRPDTETLIEAALERVADTAAPLTFLDLGTGSGCILLALLHELPQATGVGVEKSAAAVAVAKGNAERLHMQERAAFIESDWDDFSPTQRFDMVVSNPPYIPAGDTVQLSAAVAEFEPDLALYGGTDGLDCYRAILSRLPGLLKADGTAIFEMGMGQEAQVSALAKQYGFVVEAVKNDMQGICRCIILKPCKKD